MLRSGLEAVGLVLLATTGTSLPAYAEYCPPESIATGPPDPNQYNWSIFRFYSTYAPGHGPKDPAVHNYTLSIIGPTFKPGCEYDIPPFLATCDGNAERDSISDFKACKMFRASKGMRLSTKMVEGDVSSTKFAVNFEYQSRGHHWNYTGVFYKESYRKMVYSNFVLSPSEGHEVLDVGGSDGVDHAESTGDIEDLDEIDWLQFGDPDEG